MLGSQAELIEGTAYALAWVIGTCPKNPKILYYIIPLVSFNIIRNSDVDVVDQTVLKMNIKCWGGGKQRISEHISI